MKDANVCVVIPSFNGGDMIAACLDGLRRQTMAHAVIVVDQGSNDDTEGLVREDYPEVDLRVFPDNAGFDGGVNRGIRPALEHGYEYIVLLNNDAVADQHWLAQLVKRAANAPKAGIVQAKIRHYDDNRLDSTGDFYSIWGLPFPRGRGEEDTGQYDAPELQDLFSASAGATLYRASMLREIGIFDERFFAYYEDVDISFRANLAGWSVLYEPTAVVKHRVNATADRMGHKAGSTPSSFARFHSVKNFHLLYTKNMPGWLYWKYLPRYWASWAMLLVNDAGRGLLVANLKGNLVALAYLPAMLVERWKIQSARKVSVSVIDGMLYHELPPIQLKRFRKLGLMK